MNRNLALLFAAALLLGAVVANADDDDDDDEHERPRGGKRTAAVARTTPEWKAYEAECGSCHLAFPPNMLPAPSWKSLMGGLNDHFGQNATVDAATKQTLEAWLVKNAGGPLPKPTLRITTTNWWVREHDEISPSVYARKSITSAANCAACHTRANEGAFGEHEVRIPRDAPAPR